MFNRSVGCCNKISGWQFNRLFAGLSKSDQDTIFLVEGIYLISSNLAVGSITACGLGRSALRETLAVGKSSSNRSGRAGRKRNSKLRSSASGTQLKMWSVRKCDSKLNNQFWPINTVGHPLSHDILL